MLRLGIDVDGVLADFRTAFRSLAARELGVPLTDLEADLTSTQLDRLWKAVRETANWWLDLPPYEPDQISRLYSLARQGRWEVFFLTSRPPSGGDAVQLQTQVWLERLGFLLPSVLTTAAGARGEIARSLRLDLVLDDRVVNCLEVISASNAKAVLVERDRADGALREGAESRGIGVVDTLAQAVDAVERLEQNLASRRGRLLRLSDWFSPKKDEARLPQDPRHGRGSG